ncbi:hypothetical protein KFL_000520310 [Klebsormidium nitens]|uniref:Uncharacterized protein n=1 Tax=Klebsormidium nitens TaxID=105231 RepID=A0A1Y1HT38_KLENI|nr:hypothetical protein KFL_000520310 [Klebsormidium nitens]|eukprot:GAQ80359.1 hypothetical protein KFL_000520310 [Klebsormidium nitens]
MESATLLQQVTALKSELDAVDASITYEIGKTREIESSIVLCEDEVRSWEDEEQSLLREHCTFATQAEDFENLKQALKKEKNRLDEEILLAKRIKDEKQELLEKQRQEFIDFCKSFHKAQLKVDLAKERKGFEQACNQLQKSIDKVSAETELQKEQDANRVRTKKSAVTRLRDKREGLNLNVKTAERTLAAAKVRAERIAKETVAHERDQTLRRLVAELDAVEDEIATLSDCTAGLEAQLPKITNENWMLDNRIKQKRAQCNRLEQRAKVHEITQISACFEASLNEEADDYSRPGRELPQQSSKVSQAYEAPATGECGEDPLPTFTRFGVRKNRPQMKPLFDYDDSKFMRPYTGSAKITELEDSQAQSDENAELLNYQWSKKRTQ